MGKSTFQNYFRRHWGELCSETLTCQTEVSDLELSYKSEKHWICFNSINHLRNKVVNRFDLVFLKNFVRLCFSFMFHLRQVK